MFDFDFRYAEQFLIAAVLMSLTVVAHYMGMTWVRHFYRRFWRRGDGARSRNLVMMGIAVIMLGTHVVEIFIWAVFFFLRGVITDWLSAVYFSLASYTTLGDSAITLPDHWRGMGGFEAMNAMLMFGWSTAVLAAVVVKLHSLDD